MRLIWTFEFNIIGSNGWSRRRMALLEMVTAERLTPVLHPGENR